MFLQRLTYPLKGNFFNVSSVFLRYKFGVTSGWREVVAKLSRSYREDIANLYWRS